VGQGTDRGGSGDRQWTPILKIPNRGGPEPYFLPEKRHKSGGDGMC